MQKVEFRQEHEGVYGRKYSCKSLSSADYAISCEELPTLQAMCIQLQNISTTFPTSRLKRILRHVDSWGYVAMIRFNPCSLQTSFYVVQREGIAAELATQEADSS